MSPPIIPSACNYCFPHCLPPHFTNVCALGRTLPTLSLTCVPRRSAGPPPGYGRTVPHHVKGSKLMTAGAATVVVVPAVTVHMDESPKSECLPPTAQSPVTAAVTAHNHTIQEHRLQSLGGLDCSLVVRRVYAPLSWRHQPTEIQHTLPQQSALLLHCFPRHQRRPRQ
jgi:hypothetical protein